MKTVSHEKFVLGENIYEILLGDKMKPFDISPLEEEEKRGN